MIVAPRNCGKTVLLNDLLYETRHHYDFALAMVGTKSTADTLSEIMPSDFIYGEGYDLEMAQKFIDELQKLKNQKKIKNGVLILDDCVYDAKVMKSQPIRTLHLNGRHFLSTVFETTQYAMAIPPQVRTNIDYVVALKDDNKSNRKKLYEHFFGCYDSFKEFEHVFETLTANFGAIVLDKTSVSGTVLKWYRARVNLPKFIICKPVYFWIAEWIRYLLTRKTGRKSSSNKTVRIVKRAR